MKMNPNPEAPSAPSAPDAPDKQGNLIIGVYGFPEQHEKFKEWVATFRQRWPSAYKTPNLAELRFYNLRYNSLDLSVLERDLGVFVPTPGAYRRRFWFLRVLRGLARLVGLRPATERNSSFQGSDPWVEKIFSKGDAVQVIPLVHFPEFFSNGQNKRVL